MSLPFGDKRSDLRPQTSDLRIEIEDEDDFASLSLCLISAETTFPLSFEPAVSKELYRLRSKSPLKGPSWAQLLAAIFHNLARTDFIQNEFLVPQITYQCYGGHDAIRE
jgi:hypothetical protein